MWQAIKEKCENIEIITSLNVYKALNNPDVMAQSASWLWLPSKLNEIWNWHKDKLWSRIKCETCKPLWDFILILIIEARMIHIPKGSHTNADCAIYQDQVDLNYTSIWPDKKILTFLFEIFTLEFRLGYLNCVFTCKKSKWVSDGTRQLSS